MKNSIKIYKIIYWIATGLLSLILLGAAGTYLFNHAEVTDAFQSLGYPVHIIYPLAVAKILGVVAILTKKSEILKEWAYAGLFYHLVLAVAAHVNAGDGKFGAALAALVLSAISYLLDKKIFIPTTEKAEI